MRARTCAALAVCTVALRDALGDQVFEWFIRNKRLEWHDYRTRVTEWERDSYLQIL